MAWRFDPQALDLRWVVEPEEILTEGVLDLGTIESDISVDTGERTNDSSVLDQGVRIIDGNI
jgi:hypothetical protein